MSLIFFTKGTINYDGTIIGGETPSQMVEKGMVAPFAISCANHEGAGKFALMQWDGKKFNKVKDWTAPNDPKFVRQLVEDSAAKFAKENNITPKKCS